MTDPDLITEENFLADSANDPDLIPEEQYKKSTARNLGEQALARIRAPFQIAGKVGAKAHEGYEKIEELIGKGGAKYGPGFAAVGVPATMAAEGAKLLLPKNEQEAELQAAIPVAGKLIGMAGKAVAPSAAKLGSQLLHATTGVPEKYGLAAFSDLQNLSKAKSKEIIDASYRAFEKYTGLKSLRNVGAESGELLLKPGRAEEIINSAYQKVISGAKATAQELYEASQAARYLKDQARFGDPNQLANLSNLNRAKSAVDDALQKFFPEYKNLRNDTFLSKMAEQFSSLLPLKKNLSANVLRTTSALAGAIGGAATGHPGALAALPVISPKVWGGAIRTAGSMANAAKATAPLGRIAAPGAVFIIRLVNGKTVKVSDEETQDIVRSGQGKVIGVTKK